MALTRMSSAYLADVTTFTVFGASYLFIYAAINIYH